MESLSLEEENIIADVRNLFRLKKELNCAANKELRNLFRLEKKTKAVKDRTLRDIRIILSMKKKKKIVINQ